MIAIAFSAAGWITPADAQQRKKPALSIGGPPPATGPCVEVDIEGDRAGHLDCATQRLEDAARTAQREARAGQDLPVAGAGSPDTEVGVASRSATRLRLRENFGKSVRPPVSPAPVYTNPLGNRR